jgi:hypothetical protein
VPVCHAAGRPASQLANLLLPSLLLPSLLTAHGLPCWNLAQAANGWWVGINTRTQRNGIFPGTYVEEL